MKFKTEFLNPMSSFVISKDTKRNLTITKRVLNKTLEVYNGKKNFKVKITSKHLGRKMGEFSFTRKIGKIHTSKN